MSGSRLNRFGSDGGAIPPRRFRTGMNGSRTPVSLLACDFRYSAASCPDRAYSWIETRQWMRSCSGG